MTKQKKTKSFYLIGAFILIATSVGLMSCRTHMPHAFTWPGGGNVQQTHPKPPEGGYYSNWDPYAVELEAEPLKDVNPVETQHVIVATVKDKDGKPLPNRRVEWIISEGSVGDIVEVDESGWRASRGYKVTNKYAVSHTNNGSHVLDRGNFDPGDDINLTEGQTWCVITSPVEGDTHVTVYAPGIYDWNKHKVFVTKHWYDVAWEFPPPATNRIGTSHEFVTKVMKHSDGTPLKGYIVNYSIVDGPAGSLLPGGGSTASVRTDDAGLARVTLKQSAPAEGTNNISVEIIRPEDKECCKPAANIANGGTSKTWVGPRIAINKEAPAQAAVGETFRYSIAVSNPANVSAEDVVVTDTLPDGIAYVSSSPAAQVAGQRLTWSLGSLAAGGSKMIGVTVKGSRTGVFNNCAEVAAADGLSGRDCATTKIVAGALALEKICPAEVLICDPITYEVIVRNTGDGPATNVKITDQLPEGVTTTEGRSSVVANVGTLNPGEARRAKFTARATKTGTFVNRASVTGDGGLTAEAECRTVVRQPVLSITKTGPKLRYLGRTAVFEITVSNSGNAPAAQTVLTDTVPAGLEFVEASDNGNYSQGNVTWSLGTLQPGAARTVSVNLRATQMGTARNTATASAQCADDVQAVAEMEISGMSAILLEVIDIEDPIEVGGNVTYVIAVTNQGSAIGTNIRLVCELPPEEQFVSSDGPTASSVDGRMITLAPLASLAPKAKATYRIVVKGVEAGDVRFKVSMTSDQSTTPATETEGTHIY